MCVVTFQPFKFVVREQKHNIEQELFMREITYYLLFSTRLLTLSAYLHCMARVDFKLAALPDLFLEFLNHSFKEC